MNSSTMIDFAVFDDVVPVPLEERVRFERLVEVVGQLEVLLVVQVVDAEHLLDLGDALFGDGDRCAPFRRRCSPLLLEPGDDLGELVVEVGRLLAPDRR